MKIIVYFKYHQYDITFYFLLFWFLVEEENGIYIDTGIYFFMFIRISLTPTWSEQKNLIILMSLKCATHDTEAIMVLCDEVQHQIKNEYRWENKTLGKVFMRKHSSCSGYTFVPLSLKANIFLLCSYAMNPLQ